MSDVSVARFFKMYSTDSYFGSSIYAQKQNSNLHSKICFGFRGNHDRQCRLLNATPSMFRSRTTALLCLSRLQNCYFNRPESPDCLVSRRRMRGAAVVEDHGEPSDDDEDEELCPVDCVREFKTDEEFFRILEKAKENNALVVVDFYRNSCGSCKYIEQGFAKLCKGSGDQEAPVIFLKHNVIDEYDEQSEVADRLRIKTVPLFHFYKKGVLLEAFATRDKEKIDEAILKYTSTESYLKK